MSDAPADAPPAPAPREVINTTTRPIAVMGHPDFRPVTLADLVAGLPPIIPGSYTFGRGLTETVTVVDLDYAGTTSPTIGGVFVTGRSATQGLALAPGTGALTAPLASPTLAGSMVDAPADGTTYGRNNAAWVATTGATTPLTFGIGLDYVPGGGTNVDLIAATAAVIGGVSVIARGAQQGLTMTGAGALTLPPASATLMGGVTVPVRSATQAIDLSATGVATVPAATAALLGGVSVPARSATQGLLNTAGVLTAPVATPLLAGVMVEAPSDGFQYTRRNGVWSHAMDQTSFLYSTPVAIATTITVGQNIDFGIPAASLPTVAIQYVVSGSGVGTIFFTNTNVAGMTGAAGGGNWNLFVFDPALTTWIQVASAGFSTTNPFNVADVFFRATPTTTAGVPNSTHVFTFDPAIDTQIQFRMTCAAVPTLAGTLTIGLQAQIITRA